MKRFLRNILSLVCFVLFVVHACYAVDKPKGKVTVYPAPAGEPLSTTWQVSVLNKKLPVYLVKVGPADITARMKAMDDKQNSAAYYDTAAFTAFDMEGEVPVLINYTTVINSVKVLPLSAGIKPVIKGRQVSFTITSPQNLTIEINGDIIRSLHLFANPMETDRPNLKDTNVIYFGPGIHEISRLVLGDNKTLYIAGGAVVRAIIKDDEKYNVNKETGLRGYAPSIELRGRNITVRGRGIIDASGCTTHARNMIMVRGSNINLEGVILRDASLWTIPVRQSEQVTIDNLKLLGYRANSDGIDICNSRNVTVQRCFIRTLDDLVVIKADKGQGATQHIVVKDCVLWNQLAHALSIGAEIREDISDVQFFNCDVIHDTGREWSLRVFQSDGATVSDVHFNDIRIEESKKFISLWIGKAVWSRDSARGHINNITFKNITATGAPLTINLMGDNPESLVQEVRFEKVFLNGAKLTKDAVKSNAFVQHVTIE
jgi:polygalacturonase